MRENIIVGMFFLLFVTLFGYFLFSVGPGSPEELVKEIAEYAYFHGQYDALQGDFKIIWNPMHECWEWSENPWGEGEKVFGNLCEYTHGHPELTNFKDLSLKLIGE